MRNRFRIFPIENSPGYMLSRLTRELNAFLYREFRSHGFEITAQQWAVLSALWETDGLYQNQLAEKTTKNRHNISAMLKLLEQQGFIHREKDSADKRLLKVRLTRSGKDLQGKLTPIALNALNKAFGGLDEEDVEGLRKIYRTVMYNLSLSNGS